MFVESERRVGTCAIAGPAMALVKTILGLTTGHRTRGPVEAEKAEGLLVRLAMSTMPPLAEHRGATLLTAAVELCEACDPDPDGRPQFTVRCRAHVNGDLSPAGPEVQQWLAPALGRRHGRVRLRPDGFWHWCGQRSAKAEAAAPCWRSHRATGRLTPRGRARLRAFGPTARRSCCWSETRLVQSRR
jgi:hypothetical protein